MDVRSKARKFLAIALSVIMAVTIFGGLPAPVSAQETPAQGATLITQLSEQGINPYAGLASDTDDPDSIDFLLGEAIGLTDDIYVIQNAEYHDTDISHHRVKLSGTIEFINCDQPYVGENGFWYCYIGLDRVYPYYDPSGTETGSGDGFIARADDGKTPLGLHIDEGDGSFDHPYVLEVIYADDEHEHDGTTFEPWLGETVLPDRAGSFYLTEDVTLSETWSISGVGMTINLCLNGHTITNEGEGSVISITDDAALDIYDCDFIGGITGGHDAEYGGGVCVSDGGIFIMNGGSVYDNEAEHGGGVAVLGGLFAMADNTATVINNAIDGVYVGTVDGGNSFFTLEHGSIMKNSGAGVCVDRNTDSGESIFKLFGDALIADNLADIYLDDGQVIHVCDDLTDFNLGLEPCTVMSLNGDGDPASDVAITKGYAEAGNTAEAVGNYFESYYPETTVTYQDGEAILQESVITPTEDTYTVYFMDELDIVDQQAVKAGDHAQAFQDPIKEDYEFTGWIYATGELFSFDDVITDDTIVWATWRRTTSGVDVSIFTDLPSGVTSTNFEEVAKEEAGTPVNEYINQILFVITLDDEYIEENVPVLKSIAKTFYLGAKDLLTKYLDASILKATTSLGGGVGMSLVDVTELPQPIEFQLKLGDLGITSYDNVAVIRHHKVEEDGNLMKRRTRDVAFPKNGDSDAIFAEGRIILASDELEDFEFISEIDGFGRLDERITDPEDYEDAYFYIDEKTGDLYLYSQFFSEFAIIHTDETVCTVTLQKDSETSLQSFVVVGTEMEVPTLQDTSTQKFVGWTNKETGELVTDKFTVEGDTTLVPKWRSKSTSGGRHSGGGGGSGGTTVTPANPTTPTTPTNPTEPTNPTNPTEPTTPTGHTHDFKDVPANAWFHDAIDFVYAYGIMKGITDDEFGPDLPLSRGMLSAILYRMSGVDDGNVNFEMPFDDVSSEMYYYTPIGWAYSHGIVKGITDDKFGPDIPITREDFVTMLYRYAQFKHYDTNAKGDLLTKFKDSGKVSTYAKEAIEWAVEQGIISGRDDNTIDPGAEITRAESATIFQRLMEKFK